MEPCCGIARTAGRRAARRAIFRTTMAIDVPIAGVSDLTGREFEIFRIFFAGGVFCVVDFGYYCSRPGLLRESVRVNKGPNECNERMLFQRVTI